MDDVDGSPRTTPDEATRLGDTHGLIGRTTLNGVRG